MSDQWRIDLTRDEGLVLSDYLDRWSRTDNYALAMDFAERAAFMALLALLEKADDGTVFSPDYANDLDAAKARLVEQFGEFT